MYRDVPVRDLGCQLVLEVVDINEDAVEFFFFLFELLEAGLAFRLSGGEFVGD